MFEWENVNLTLFKTMYVNKRVELGGGLVISVPASRLPVPGSNLGPGRGGPPHSVV